MKPRPLRLIPSLASAHLRHEWILTLCLVIALAAVIAPLLVLLGLKHGTIQTLRERLVEDPVFREIRPVQTREFKPEWFEELAARPETGFLTPTILPLSSTVSISVQGKSELLDLIPTAQGDPLLLENNGVIPADGETVLSAEAARLAGIKAGENITVRVTRSIGGRMEQEEAVLRVAAVLDSRAGSLPRLYAPLSFVLDVEAYKEGYAAPDRGWKGQTPEPYLSFDGAVLLLPEALPPITRTGLIINTGFGGLSELSPEKAAELLGFEPPSELFAYVLTAPGSAVTASSLRAVEQKLRGLDRVLLPYAQISSLELDGKTTTVIGLSLNAEQARLLNISIPPWPAYTGRLPAGNELLQILWPQSAESEPASVEASGLGLSFPLRVTGSTSLDRPVLPVELLGVLRTATQRSVTFSRDQNAFEMARGGFRGFRLYAKNIDGVPSLYRWLQSEEVAVTAEVAAIERIQVLDQGLNRLFWLIALLGLFGGTAVLVASLYAAVERRRRDLGVLRLLGFARHHVFFFPVVQAMLMAALGLLAGFGGYSALSFAINTSFASELAPGQAFCALPSAYIPIFCLVTLGLAALASLAAAWRTTRIDPAEVLREQ